MNEDDKKHAVTSRRERHSSLVSRGDAGSRCCLFSRPRVLPHLRLCLLSLFRRRGHHFHEQVSASYKVSRLTHNHSQEGERRAPSSQALSRRWSSKRTTWPSPSMLAPRCCLQVVVWIKDVDTRCYTKLEHAPLAPNDDWYF